MGIHNGVDGLMAGEVKPIGWSDVTGWVAEGGALLGTKRTLPGENYQATAQQLGRFGIQGLVVIGGFEAFQAVLQMAEQRDTFKEFRIPMVVLPATISNNVPGTDFSIGADTALNEITEICDRIRQSAQGTKRRVFIVETMGGGWMGVVVIIMPPLSRILWLPRHYGWPGWGGRCCLYSRGEVWDPGADEGLGHHGLQDGQGEHL